MVVSRPCQGNASLGFELQLTLAKAAFGVPQLVIFTQHLPALDAAGSADTAAGDERSAKRPKLQSSCLQGSGALSPSPDADWSQDGLSLICKGVFRFPVQSREYSAELVP